jgi:hypothetical protein
MAYKLDVIDGGELELFKNSVSDFLNQNPECAKQVLKDKSGKMEFIFPNNSAGRHIAFFVWDDGKRKQTEAPPAPVQEAKPEKVK